MNVSNCLRRNPNWSRFYSSSEEIWQYFKDVATKYSLEKYVKFNTKVETAKWDDEDGVWRLEIMGPDGKRFEDSCEILVNGSGVLKSVYIFDSDLLSMEFVFWREDSSWKYPNIPGIKDFKGKFTHSATWDKDYDLKGKTVAILGGGSSAVQIIPNIQPSKILYSGAKIWRRCIYWWWHI